MKNTCATCNAFLKGSNGKDGVCRAEPPKPIMIGFGQSAIAMGMQDVQPVINSYFPTMMSDGWCRGWQAKVELVESN
jgi:hypothetical protein